MGSGVIVDGSGVILTDAAIHSKSGGYKGVGFALPINAVRRLMLLP